MKNGQFDLTPSILIQGYRNQCWSGWNAIATQLAQSIQARTQVSQKLPRFVVTIECYPGVYQEEIVQAFDAILHPKQIVPSQDGFLSPEEIQALIQHDLTDDPVFGRISKLQMHNFIDAKKKQQITQQITAVESGIVLIVGPGALLLAETDLIVYADLPRWEAQLRFRQNTVDNLGVRNRNEAPSKQYKQAFFVDWRVADRLKIEYMEQWDYWLDTVQTDCPKMVTGEAIRSALRQTTQRPFSVVPYFDPAPWGGKWMQEKFGLDPTRENFGWCFNCVPEENSLLFDFEGTVVESPAMNLTLFQPVELLGEDVFSQFGAEFPIRFDYLDTIGGGNLSFQVHPIKEYIVEQFGMTYTQDESYYILAAGKDATVFLGLKDDVQPEEMIRSLYAAQNGGGPFNDRLFVNEWPAKKHDHFLIPAGTTHCSGRDAMVLEISATPYIFTFKLWDWGRVGLDGEPRPIHIQHGEKVIQWDRTTDWVQRELINRIEPIAQADGWREERTGLHELEFIETRRHWFTGTVPHHTGNTVNVLCLIEGDSAIVESPEKRFEPFEVRYGEVFIVPAAVGAYTVTPNDSTPNREYATMKAFVRKS